jgi:hypothetical protein
MFVAEVPNRGSNPTFLLRESYREQGKVKSRTLANLTKLPPDALEAVRRVLRNEVLASATDLFEVTRSLHHGHVDAVLSAMKRLGVAELLASAPCRQRDLVMGMVAARILEPSSKLEATRWWKATTLPSELGLGNVEVNDLYGALDWLLSRQDSIERKLAKRHLEPCGLVLYDLTSTWMEGTTCPLAKRGYSRDGRKNSLQVNFGLLTDEGGRPVAVRVYEGNTADPKTVKDQVAKLREQFALDLVVLVGDRGMVTQTHVSAFKNEGGVEWITALKTGAIRALTAEGSLQMSLFDERNLFAFESPQHPGERLVACRNLELAKRRAHKREELLAATEAALGLIQRLVGAGRLKGKDAIGVRVGKVVDKYKMAKHFELHIGETTLRFERRKDKIAEEAALDGIYVVRTSVPAEAISDADVVRHYKRLTRVERAFRSMKTVDLKVRPIYHRLENRVRAHVLLCMLAYYVEWHMQRAWAPLLFKDEVDTLMSRDPVLPAKRSPSAQAKVSKRRTEDGATVHSFRSLLGLLSAVVRNVCKRKAAAATEPTFEMTTTADVTQQRALALIHAIEPV